VTAFLALLGSLIGVLRIALLIAAVILLVIAAADWAVRTRRVNPFSMIARFFRRVLDPLLAPIEARVVRAGGLPSQAPWWALAAVVVSGVILIVLLQWLARTVLTISLASHAGGSALVLLVLDWVFGILKLALIVRVLVSWIGGRYSWWGRVSHALTDWLVRPIARVLPPFGMIDFSPIAAYLLIVIVESAVLPSIFA
jgi:YggT family protein